MGLPSPYLPFRAASARSPWGGRRWLWDFCTDSRAPLPLRFCLVGSYTNLKNRKSIARRHVVGGIAQSPHGQGAESTHSKMARWRHHHHTIFVQPLHESRTGSVRLPSGGCGDCTATPLRLHDFRTISAQPLYGFTPACPPPPPPPEVPYKKSHDARRQCEHIRRSHLRCPKNRTENHRQIYRTAPGANVTIGATLETAMNNLYSSPKKVYTHYITLLFYLNWIWRRVWNLQSFGPSGPCPWAPHRSHMYHMNNFESPTPKDDSCHVWLKSDNAFSRRRKCKKFTDDARRTMDENGRQ